MFLIWRYSSSTCKDDSPVADDGRIFVEWPTKQGLEHRLLVNENILLIQTESQGKRLLSLLRCNGKQEARAANSPSAPVSGPSPPWTRRTGLSDWPRAPRCRPSSWAGTPGRPGSARSAAGPPGAGLPAGPPAQPGPQLPPRSRGTTHAHQPALSKLLPIDHRFSLPSHLKLTQGTARGQDTDRKETSSSASQPSR